MRPQPFSNFKDFYEFYLKQIEEVIPDYEDVMGGYVKDHAGYYSAKNPDAIHYRLPKITRDEVIDLNYKIKSIQPIPSNVALVYRKDLDPTGRQIVGTFYSWYNKWEKRLEIVYPTVTKIMMAYPELIKTAIKHELGHILKGDIFVKMTPDHKSCINIAQDLRINSGLDEDLILGITKCLVFQKPAHEEFAVIPRIVFPQIGLRVRKGNYSWERIHNAIHRRDDENRQLSEHLQNLQKSMDKLQNEGSQGESMGDGDSPQGGQQSGGGKSQSNQKQPKIQKGSVVRIKGTDKFGMVDYIEEDGKIKVSPLPDEIQKQVEEKYGISSFMTFATVTGATDEFYSESDLELINLDQDDSAEGDSEGENGGANGGQNGGKEGNGSQSDLGESAEGSGETEKEISEKDVKKGIKNAQKALDDLEKGLDDPSSGDINDKEVAKDAIEKARQELNDLEKDVDDGKYDNDLEAANARKKNIVDKALDAMRDVDQQIDDQVKAHQPNNNTVIRDTTSCGTMEQQPEYSPTDEFVGKCEVENALDEIRENPQNYPDLQEYIASGQQGGGSPADATTFVKLEDTTRPSFIRELKKELSAFKKQRKVQEYYDVETFVSGLPTKKKEKKMRKEKTVLCILDTSGSMWYSKIRGKNLMVWMLEHIFPILRKYEGALWEADTELAYRVPFKKLRKQYEKNLQQRIVGGGGTDLDQVMGYVKYMKENRVWLEEEDDPKTGKPKETKLQQKSDFLTIGFTDGYLFRWDFYMPENFIMVVPKGGAAHVKKHLTFDPTKNQKIIEIDIETDD